MTQDRFNFIEQVGRRVEQGQVGLCFAAAGAGGEQSYWLLTAAQEALGERFSVGSFSRKLGDPVRLQRNGDRTSLYIGTLRRLILLAYLQQELIKAERRAASRRARARRAGRTRSGRRR